MSKKIFWFDLETTGLDAIDDEILTLSGIVDIDGAIVDNIHLEICPDDMSTISDDTVLVHGLSRDKIKSFLPSKEAYVRLIRFLEKHVDRYDKYDKFVPAGYNVSFDIRFLRQFFDRQNDQFYGSWFTYQSIDVYQFISGLSHMYVEFPIPRKTLKTVCKYFGIHLKAHDSRSDIKATRHLYYLIMTRTKYFDEEY